MQNAVSQAAGVPSDASASAGGRLDIGDDNEEDESDSEDQVDEVKITHVSCEICNTGSEAPSSELRSGCRRISHNSPNRCF
jgi:hypothetical protein